MAGLQDRLPQRSAPGPSQTQTETQSRTGTQAILRLRGAHAPSRQSVRWAEDVVDNEGLGRKSSKVCCIYHRPKGVDESSDESSSDSSDDSSASEADTNGGRRRVPSGDHKGKGKGKKSGKRGDHDHDCGDHGHGRKAGREGSEKRRPSPNAYERVPKPPKPKDEGSGGSPAKA